MTVTHTMQDEVAIRQIVKDLEAAWNNRDGQAYARPFEEDAEFRAVWGFKVEGYQAIAEGHQRIFDNQYQHSRMESRVESMRFIRPDVVRVETTNVLHNVDIPFEKAIASLILTKKQGEWRIATLNNAGILPSEN